MNIRQNPEFTDYLNSEFVSFGRAQNTWKLFLSHIGRPASELGAEWWPALEFYGDHADNTLLFRLFGSQFFIRFRFFGRRKTDIVGHVEYGRYVTDEGYARLEPLFHLAIDESGCIEGDGASISTRENAVLAHLIALRRLRDELPQSTTKVLAVS